MHLKKKSYWLQVDFKQLKIWKRLKNKYKESKVQEYITFFTVAIEWNQIHLNNLETASHSQSKLFSS